MDSDSPERGEEEEEEDSAPAMPTVNSRWRRASQSGALQWRSNRRRSEGLIVVLVVDSKFIIGHAKLRVQTGAYDA